jgi:Ca2+-binding RTX toxin-like protein
MALTAVLVLLVPAALADDQVFDDPNDSRSRIDIERVVQGHHQQMVRYRLEAYEEWQTEDLRGGRIVLSFNTDKDKTIERRAIMEYIGGGGSETRVQIVNARGKSIGRGVSRRPARRSVEFWIARWQLGRPKKYHTFVTVSTAEAGCGRNCVDRIPDRGAMVHRLHSLCTSGEATIKGTNGNDVLRGTKGADVIDALAGDDTISHVGPHDTACGGPGDDRITGGYGWHTLLGGRGADHLSATGPAPRPCNDVITPPGVRTAGRTFACAYPEAFLRGGPGPDVLDAGRYHEYLLGGNGDDVLYGRAWSDRLDGGNGDDELFGGRGGDNCARGETLHSCEY